MSGYSSWLAGTILILSVLPLIIVTVAVEIEILPDVYKYSVSTGEKTEFSNYFISNEKIILEKQRSPYLVKKDIFIDEDGELFVEPGVTMLFAPNVGITVKGILIAKVSNERI